MKDRKVYEEWLSLRLQEWSSYVEQSGAHSDVGDDHVIRLRLLQPAIDRARRVRRADGLEIEGMVIFSERASKEVN